MDLSNSKIETQEREFKGTTSWLDSVFVLRPTLIFPLITMTLAGLKLADQTVRLSADKWLFITISLCSLFGLVYLLNQLKDKDTDGLNGKLYFIPNGILSRRHIRLEAIVLGAIIPLCLILAGVPYLIGWVLLMFVVAGVLYNFTPVALQQSPSGSILAGAIGGWMLIHMGGLMSHQALSVVKELPYVLAFTAACMLTTLPDIQGDFAVGKRTVAVVFGTKKTAVIAMILILTSLVWGILLADWVIVIPAGITFPILTIGILRNDVRIMIMANKAAILSLSLAVGFYYPIYLVAIGLYFPFARWYYWKRFKIRYPSFSIG